MGSKQSTGTGLRKHPKATSSAPAVEKRGLRILALDGGGVRALATIQVLREIERAVHPRRLGEVFDLIGGTSAGGLMALALGEYNCTVDELEPLCMILNQAVMTRSTAIASASLISTGAAYDSSKLVAILKSQYGESTVLADLTTKVFVTSSVSYHLINDSIPPELCLWRSYECQSAPKVGQLKTNKEHVWAAASSTSAAPGYFRPIARTLPNGEVEVHKDGGLHANCPALVSVEEAELVWPNVPITLCVSVGTGTSKNAHTSEDKDDSEEVERQQSSATTFEPQSKSGSSFASRLFRDLKHVLTGCDEAARRAQERLTSVHTPRATELKLPSPLFLRLQPELDQKVSLAETNVKVLEAMKQQARTYASVQKENADFQTAVSRLNDSSTNEL